jgi:PD-(D/E)XK nuclease superfamily protein/AddB-like protein
MLGAMSLSLIVGPPNSGRAGEIRARLEAALDRDPVLVVPTLDDADRFERELCREGGAVVGASIGTFRRLADEVAASTGAGLRPLLSTAQRLALIRAAARHTELRLLSGSAARPGFAPTLQRLIGELQAALVEPDELARAAAELDDGGYEEELARLYAAYVERRAAAGRDDLHSAARRVAASLRRRHAAWGERPVLVYGFDDLTEEQLELLAALAGATEVTVAVNYEDREALAARAGLMARLHEELDGNVECELPFDREYTESATLRQLDKALFEPGAARVAPDDGIALLECAGERGEAEAIGGEIARLLADGVAPDDVAIVLRHPESRGLLYAQVLDGFGIPVAVEAHVPLVHTAVGRGLTALARASAPEGSAADLLAFMRARPGVPQGIADWIERGIRRNQVRTAQAAVADWKAPPAMLARLREARGNGWLRALAAAARELAEEAHKGQEPVQGQATPGDGGTAVPFEPLEVRAAVAAASTLEELAGLESVPGCTPPSPAEALEALEDLHVPLWRGPTQGRVRVLSPYRVRVARARHLFVASLQDGEFPGAQAGDPLLGDERRARLGIPALVRQDPGREERYLFHACVSRPTERLWLSWRSSDEDGRPATRSPFVDDVLDLLGPTPEQAEEGLKRVHGLDRVVFAPIEAPGPRELARSLAAFGPRLEPELPGPLANADIIAELARRDPVGAGTLENWIECPYRWFVDHELAPQRLEPEPEPLTAGSVVHEVLERLYRDPPGGDAIPRPGDLERWRDRAAELLVEEVERHGLRLDRPLSRIALARMRAQIDRLLERESRSETELRPALLEASFADEEGCDKGSVDLGDLRIHGKIDRVDTTPDGRFGLIYDYKTGSKVWAGKKLGEEGKLQLQLYGRALRDLWEIEPLGGLYYQLGGSGNPKPRGFVVDDVQATDALDLTRTDRLADELVLQTLEAGVETAREKAAAMRRGEIGRDPNQGRCPPWCRYQPICRLERSIGVEEPTANGDDAANGG